VLDLDNNFIGEIPLGIISRSGGTQLTELYLSHNEITSIPDGLFQLQNVTHLWLRNNKISSPLPSGLGMMKKLVELDLEHNFFTGTIPEEIYRLVNLQTLYLYDNILTGALSPSLSQMKSLKILDLHTNYISGVIPTEIGLLSQLTELQ
jgi:Leucine-rich repeat (LRR) protein